MRSPKRILVHRYCNPVDPVGIIEKMYRIYEAVKISTDPDSGRITISNRTELERMTANQARSDFDYLED
jgi:hypothetical protein